ncbi:hypothetical protein QN365_23795, partial [Pseudomonas sp. RTI1]|nr:hypothetical protein [Pseudomonas sp. RTI1]
MLQMNDNNHSFTYNVLQYVGDLGAELKVNRNDELKRIQRRDARIINSPFKLTLIRAAIAHQLEDGR